MAGVAAGNDDANFGESLLALLIVIAMAVIGGFMVKMIRGVRFGKKWPGCLKNLKLQGCFNCGVCKKIVIPPLIGEVVMGAISRNFLPSSVMDKYDDQWASYIRMMCLAVILLRGGMELEFAGKQLAVILLTSIPPLTEGIITALVAYGWLDMPFSLALCLGSVLGAVSPGVLVPCLMNLQVRGYGIAKGIPLTLLAGSSFNDVFNITLFAVTSTIAYNKSGKQNDSIGGVLLKILLEIIGGVAAGFILGLLMKFVTPLNHALKAAITLTITTAFVVVSEAAKVHEAKFVGIIMFGYMCFRYWGVHGKPEKILANLWTCMTPFLFGTIGAALKFDDIDSGSILPGICIVIIGIMARGASTVGSMSIPRGYTLKEKLFMGIAWIPKATVQAAIGGVMYDFAKNEDVEDYKKPGNQILTIAVISVILCAPVGAILTITYGQKWLDKKEKPKQIQKKFSKWDIVYIYVMDYLQRLHEKKKDPKNNPDEVTFYLSDQQKLARMQDTGKFLYQLKVYKEDMEGANDEIEMLRLQIQEELGSDIEFASAFSSLAGSRDGSRIEQKQQDLERKIGLRMVEQKDVDDIQIETNKNNNNSNSNNNNNNKDQNSSKDNGDHCTNDQEQNGPFSTDQEMLEHQQIKIETEAEVIDVEQEYNDNDFEDVQELSYRKCNIDDQNSVSRKTRSVVAVPTMLCQSQQPKFKVKIH